MSETRARRSGGRAARQAARMHAHVERVPFLTRALAPLEVLSEEGLATIEANAERIQKVVLDMIGRFPADLDALGARGALEHTRGDGHATSPEDIRLFETGL